MAASGAYPGTYILTQLATVAVVAKTLHCRITDEKEEIDHYA
jgi:hypothetical protein